MSERIRIGTRASKLARWQTNLVAERLRAAHSELEVRIETISTKGDRNTATALSKMEGKGLFTKELEQALLKGTVDVCVHSMKDLPTQLPKGLTLTAVLPRADVRDALICSPALATKATTIADLPAGTVLGTSALRRRAQLMALRPDLTYVDLRGNLDTRLDKVAHGDPQAAILAAAGITRMGWASRITSYIDPMQSLPAAGQGIIGIESRVNDPRIRELCAAINDDEAMLCVTAERQIMDALNGGCQTPFAAYARLVDVTGSADNNAGNSSSRHPALDAGPSPTDAENGGDATQRFAGRTLRIDALVASLDGTRIIRANATGSPAAAQALAQQVTDSLLGQGAAAIMEEARAQA